MRELTNETIQQVTNYYRELVTDYDIDYLVLESIVRSTTDRTYKIRFKNADKTLFLEDAISELNLPELEEVLSKL